MHIHLSPRHLTLTSAIHSFVATKVESLETITEEILAAHVVLIHDESKNPTKRYHVKVHLAMPGPDIHAEDYDADLYAGIDKVTSKLARQIRKRKTKLVDKKKQDTQKKMERAKRGI